MRRGLGSVELTGKHDARRELERKDGGGGERERRRDREGDRDLLSGMGTMSPWQVGRGSYKVLR